MPSGFSDKVSTDSTVVYRACGLSLVYKLGVRCNNTFPLFFIEMYPMPCYIIKAKASLDYVYIIGREFSLVHCRVSYIIQMILISP